MGIQEREEFEQVDMFGIEAPNTGFARYSTGNPCLNPSTKLGESSMSLANVTFEPGCRDDWYIYHADEDGGQILVCTAGSGWYQERGKGTIGLEPGVVVTIPTEARHWHGVKADSQLSHIAVEVLGTNTGDGWCKSITDREYEKLL